MRAAFGSAARDLANGNEVYVEKTPRNCLLLPELFDVFPDALFVIMRRHPFSIARSLLRGIPSRRGTVERYHVDLLLGLPRLALSMSALPGNAVSLTIDDVVSDLPGVVRKVAYRLGMNVPRVDLAPRPEGRMGDPDEGSRLPGVDLARVGSWRDGRDGRREALLFRRTLDALGRGGMRALGYSYDEAVDYIERLMERCPFEVSVYLTDVYERTWNRLSLAAQKEIAAQGATANGLT